LKPHSCLYEKLGLQEEDRCQAAELLPRLLLKSENYFYSGGKMKGGARRRGGDYKESGLFMIFCMKLCPRE
jgi:hypothetical protein